MGKLFLAVVILLLIGVVAYGTQGKFGTEDRDCSDFKTQPDAQAFYEAHQPSDPHRLDRDKDGIACEALSKIKLRRNPYTK